VVVVVGNPFDYHFLELTPSGEACSFVCEFLPSQKENSN
jgi:hypothetical protein